MLKYIPNLITILRFLMFPAICSSVFYGFRDGNMALQIAGSVLFAVAMISDFLDGFLARIWKVESEFGRCFDNIADKVLNISLICTLLALQRIPLIPSLMVIFREIFISALREYAAVNGARIAVDMLGKVKTTFQFIGLFLIINVNLFDLNFSLYKAGNYIFYASAALSLLSCVIYIRKYFYIFYDAK